ncbi:MAG: 50S ribosomal protein L35ae [Candidatus Diapherotrites archaeon CG10_big_fil_rev_8_21_14_0_10_31_34]|nr:MAG: 50S ribosomal protein L35ae [Candidatus Diapherotrites archaeon CG10_big_fil_rev_8_21_14_0_10_31_34]
MRMVIKNFRRGRRTQHTNQFVLVSDSVNTKAKASALIGNKAEWKTTSGKIIKGKITRVHGNKGAVIARMEKGLPGTAVGTKITVKEKTKKTAKTKETKKKETKK